MDSPPDTEAAVTGPARRRSSVAYDPARDIFTEIPESNAQSTGGENDVKTEQIGIVTSSSPAQSFKPAKAAVSSPRPQKRRLDSDVLDSEQALKKTKPSGDVGGEEGSAVKSPPKEGSGGRPRQSSPRGGQVRDEYGARPTTRNRRRRPSDERPRDFERVRERPRRRSRSPGSRVPTAYRRRSPPRPTPRQRTRSPSPIRRRSPSPIRPREPASATSSAAPVRKGRNLLAEKERLQAEREARQQTGTISHGVQNAVNSWYNAVPEYVKERGKDWRRNESAIKGLRSYNNWVKSCIIQKFSPRDRVIDEVPEEELGWGEEVKEKEELRPLRVLDIGCGKGGDLGKWEKAPQPVGLYVGLDPADTSILQASDRYRGMWRGRRPKFEAQFAVKDCFGEWIGDVPIIQQVGINPHPEETNARWGRGGGFDVVTMMFSMHYSFESEEKVMMMLRNVSGALKKGGRFIGVCPDSDVLTEEVKKWFAQFGERYREAGNAPIDTNESNGANGTDGPTQIDSHTESAQSTTATGAFSAGELSTSTAPCFGNSIYSVRFPPPLPSVPRLNPDLLWRPPYANKYTYFIAEAVDVPEFVVPWPAFRAKAELFGLEQRYRKPFLDMWRDETNPATATPTTASAIGGGAGHARREGWDAETLEHEGQNQGTAAVARDLEMLGVRMGVVREAGGPLLMSEEEKEAVAFYHAFCFIKT